MVGWRTMTTPTDLKPHVLLTNDDGIAARGLHALADAMTEVADLTIVAPSSERSGAGHAVTVHKDMRLEHYTRDGRPNWGWALSGMPVDCVKVAVMEVSPDRPFDMVVSGINQGQNAGFNVLYSGTVAAAREAAFLGLPAIAMSLYFVDEADLPFETAARVGVDVFRMVRREGLPKGVVLSVNVPPVPYDQIQGWSITRMGGSCYEDFYEKTAAEGDGASLLRNVGSGWIQAHPGDEHVDDQALMRNRVSITPLQIDMTDYRFLDKLNHWIKDKE